MKLWQRAQVTFALRVVTIISILVSHLALTDIYHGEPDLRLEWYALQICLGVFVVFLVWTCCSGIGRAKGVQSQNRGTGRHLSSE